VTRDDEAAGVFVALRADLLRGDLGRLGSHLAALESIMDSLPGVADEADLTRMRAEAERSRDVLAAAAGGVRAAHRRLGEAIDRLCAGRHPSAARPRERVERKPRLTETDSFTGNAGVT
jgi:hypothetical protein